MLSVPICNVGCNVWCKAIIILQVDVHADARISVMVAFCAETAPHRMTGSIWFAVSSVDKVLHIWNS